MFLNTYLNSPVKDETGLSQISKTVLYVFSQKQLFTKILCVPGTRWSDLPTIDKGQLSNNLLGFFLQFCTASSPVLFRASPTGSIWPFLIPDGHKNSPTQLCLNRKAPTFYGGWFWETNMGDFRRQIRSWDWSGSWEGWRWPSAWAIRNAW